jgi:hypothetical protein
VWVDGRDVQYRVSWFDHLQMLSAVRTDAAITAVAAMPQDGGQGLARYAAVGDAGGKVRHRPKTEFRSHTTYSSRP